VPPTTNHIYRQKRDGSRVLTKQAQTYRERVKRAIADNMAEVVAFPIDQETVYGFELRVYFEKLENPGWFERFVKGKNAGQRKAKARYKRLDIDNRIKFVQDCVAKGVSIPDDSQVFSSLQEKHEDPQNPRAEVIVRIERHDRFFAKGDQHGEG
jgi:Holliday junction resolvase RusA-like endonuclease